MSDWQLPYTIPDGQRLVGRAHIGGSIRGANLHIPSEPVSGLHVANSGELSIGALDGKRLVIDHENVSNDVGSIELVTADPGMYLDPSVQLYFQPGVSPRGTVSLYTGTQGISDPDSSVTAVGGGSHGAAMAQLNADDPAGSSSAHVWATSAGNIELEFTEGLEISARGHYRTADAAFTVTNGAAWRGPVTMDATNPLADKAPELAEDGQGIKNVSGRILFCLLTVRGAWGSSMSAAGLRGVGIGVNGTITYGDLEPVAAGAGSNRQHGLTIPQILAPNDVVEAYAYADGGGINQSLGPGGVILGITIISDW